MAIRCSIVAGREDVMRKIGDGVVHGGTFTGTLGVVGRGSTRHWRSSTKPDALTATIANYGLRNAKGHESILDERGIAHSFTGAPALMGLFFAN